MANVSTSWLNLIPFAFYSQRSGSAKNIQALLARLRCTNNTTNWLRLAHLALNPKRFGAATPFSFRTPSVQVEPSSRSRQILSRQTSPLLLDTQLVLPQRFQWKYNCKCFTFACRIISFCRFHISIGILYRVQLVILLSLRTNSTNQNRRSIFLYNKGRFNARKYKNGCFNRIQLQFFKCIAHIRDPIAFFFSDVASWRTADVSAKSDIKRQYH